jgi:hypothetical protein
MEGHDMRISGVWFLAITLLTLLAGLPLQARAVEEGQLVKKEGRWEYYSGEDPGLKYLYLKGIITEEEYNKGLRVLEDKERLSKPNFNIDVNNGLNIRVGEKFFLKIRLLSQLRYTSHNYNSAWGTVGDARNSPDVLGGQVEFRALKQQSSVNDFTAPRTRLQFMGYAFDPDLRYNVSLQVDQNERAQGTNATAGLLDAYISSWHIPWATIQAGQQIVWFNRALITSVATTAFADNMIVQNAFAANLLNRRDIGLTVLSNEDEYRVNYAFGIWNGNGTNLTREGTSVSQATPNDSSLPSGARRTYNFDTRTLTSELMYTARLLYKISGNPGYGQGDILNSRIPQVAIGAAYAYDPGQNYLSSLRSDIVDQSLRAAVANNFNGRLLGGGVYDFQTYNVDFVAKFQGYSLQAEGYYRHQRVRSHDSGVIAYDTTTFPNGYGNPAQPNLGQAYGWYVQGGKYLIPRKLELAVRYGVMDPSTQQTHDLIKEFGAAINYSLDGTYNNRVIIDYSNITMGSGGNAPDRAVFNSIPGSGRDLIENRINVQYQLYF